MPIVWGYWCKQYTKLSGWETVCHKSQAAGGGTYQWDHQTLDTKERPLHSWKWRFHYYYLNSVIIVNLVIVVINSVIPQWKFSNLSNVIMILMIPNFNFWSVCAHDCKIPHWIWRQLAAFIQIQVCYARAPDVSFSVWVGDANIWSRCWRQLSLILQTFENEYILLLLLMVFRNSYDTVPLYYILYNLYFRQKPKLYISKNKTFLNQNNGLLSMHPIAFWRRSVIDLCKGKKTNICCTSDLNAQVFRVANVAFEQLAAILSAHAKIHRHNIL